MFLPDHMLLMHAIAQAGGSFMCAGCHVVNASRTTISSSVAGRYGGGAALAVPAARSIMRECLFEGNSVAWDGAASVADMVAHFAARFSAAEQGAVAAMPALPLPLVSQETVALLAAAGTGTSGSSAGSSTARDASGTGSEAGASSSSGPEAPDVEGCEDGGGGGLCVVSKAQMLLRDTRWLNNTALLGGGAFVSHYVGLRIKGPRAVAAAAVELSSALFANNSARGPLSRASGGGALYWTERSAINITCPGDTGVFVEGPAPSPPSAPEPLTPAPSPPGTPLELPPPPFAPPMQQPTTTRRFLQATSLADPSGSPLPSPSGNSSTQLFGLLMLQGPQPCSWWSGNAAESGYGPTIASSAYGLGLLGGSNPTLIQVSRGDHGWQGHAHEGAVCAGLENT